VPRPEKVNPFKEAIHLAMETVQHLETDWTLEEMENRMNKYFWKASSQFQKDERISQHGSSLQAQAILEEYVYTVMGAISAACYEKQWLPLVDLSAALFQSAKDTFGTSKLFARTVGPAFRKHIEEALFRFREEERLTKAMWEALDTTTLESNYKKKAGQHLLKAFDEAHVSAPYGSATEGNSLEEMMLMDFLKGWMTEFITRAWDVLENGVSPEKDAQVLFLATLFQLLAGPEMRCLPTEFQAILTEEMLPPANWAYIAQMTEAIFAEEEANQLQAQAEKAAKMRMKGMFKGKGKGKFGKGKFGEFGCW